MPISRPARIKIVSKRFTVEWVAEGDGGLSADLCGECRSHEQRILIQHDLPQDTERNVLLHEVVHAISDEMQANMTEEQVEAVANGVCAVFLDNPGFARWMVKR
jgi:hypothetical protein